MRESAFLLAPALLNCEPDAPCGNGFYSRRLATYPCSFLRPQPTYRAIVPITIGRARTSIAFRRCSSHVRAQRQLALLYATCVIHMATRECPVCCVRIVRNDPDLATCTICQRYFHSACTVATGALLTSSRPASPL